MAREVNLRFPLLINWFQFRVFAFSSFLQLRRNVGIKNHREGLSNPSILRMHVKTVV